jgi:dihydroorotase
LEALKNETDTDRLIHALSVAPRSIFGLPTASIEKGGKASLTLYTTTGKHTVNKNNAQSAANNNSWLGKEMSGRIIGIINNNKVNLNKY